MIDVCRTRRIACIDYLAKMVKLLKPGVSLIHCMYIIVQSIVLSCRADPVLVATMLVLYLSSNGLICHFSVFQIEFTFILQLLKGLPI